MTTWEGGMRVPAVIRWNGVIKPGTVFDGIFALYDWLPTFVEIAGGPKGDELNKQIMAGKYDGIKKTKLAGINQLSYLQGKTQSNRDYFFYYQGSIPSALRWKNWKFYYTMMGSTGIKSIEAPTTYAWTQVDNIGRDPFEQSWGDGTKSVTGYGGVLASPSTAYLYDWNLLPIGQLMWMKELESYAEFPPLQEAASYNLSNILQRVKEMAAQHPSE
jgi:arylsulfatase